MKLPFYLLNKLEQAGINEAVTAENYLYIFKLLKNTFNSLNYNTLYDLYAISHNMPLNSLDNQTKLLIKQSFKQMPPTHPPQKTDDIVKFLNIAKEQAVIASNLNEIPIGACIVHNNTIIATAHNLVELDGTVTSHAEIIAIDKACKHLGSLRLLECDLYVTVEPCLMCSGAIIASRVKRIIFGALEPKTGACISQYRVFDNKQCNHHTEVIGPIDTTFYASDLQNFLHSKRK